MGVVCVSACENGSSLCVLSENGCSLRVLSENGSNLCENGSSLCVCVRLGVVFMS